MWCVQHAFTRYIPPVSSLFCQHQKTVRDVLPTVRLVGSAKQQLNSITLKSIECCPPPHVNLRPCQDMPRDVGSCGIISSSSCNQLHRERPCLMTTKVELKKMTKRIVRDIIILTCDTHYLFHRKAKDNKNVYTITHMQLAACWRFFASASSSPNLFLKSRNDRSIFG